MPGKLKSFVSRNAPSAATNAKNLIKSSLQNVAAKSSSPGSIKSEESMDLLKRHKLSLTRRSASNHSSSSHDASTTTTTNSCKAARMDLTVESPPLVSFGHAADSSGALFSGQLRIIVSEPKASFKSIELRLLCSTSVRKPVVKDCADCHSNTREMKKWCFTPDGTLTLEEGEHKFPVSFLFEGILPATTHSHLAMVDYHFAGSATLLSTTKTTTSEGGNKTLSFTHTVELRRAIHPGHDKQSVRVFPPTNVTANLTHNPVIYQSGAIPMQLRLTGITSVVGKAQFRWRLRRMVWRIEEHEKAVSHACARHGDKVPPEHAAAHGIPHDEVRVVGEHEVNYHKTPWKTDLDAGEIYAEFNCALNPNKKVACDVTTPPDSPPEIAGLSISHHLVLELVVVEETAPLKRLSHATPTGAARILRAQFPLILTQRAGLGVAWDEEMPPVYQDVPPSPPVYQANTTSCAEIDIAELGDAPPLPADLVESWRLGSPLVGSAASPLVRAAASPRVVASGGGLAEVDPRGSGHSLRLSADDFLGGPDEMRRVEEEELEDVEVGDAS